MTTRGAAADLPHLHLQRWAAAGALLIVTAASVPAIAHYSGAPWRAFFFCLVAGGLLPLAILIGRSPFRILTAAFLWLGFWAKFVAHFALGAQFNEPIGLFSGSAGAWDRALLMATAGLSGVAVALVLVARLGSTEPRPAKEASADLLSRFGLVLLAISLLPALALFGFNSVFSILRVGFVPKLALHPYLYVIVAFAVSWGILLWLLALAWWLVGRQRLAPTSLVYIADVEGSLAALSMGSRVQMLLHVCAGLFVLWQGMLSRRWHIPFSGWLRMSAVVTPLFVATLLVVSLDRAVSFAEAEISPQAEVRHPDTSDAKGKPAGELNSSALEDQAIARPTPSAGAEPRRQAAVESRIRTIPHEIGSLFLMRWIGLDGVLATIETDDRLGLPLLREVIREQPAAGVDAIFQRMSHSVYTRLDNFVFMTIPGPVAIAALSGSAFICFLALAGMVVIGTLIEHLGLRLTANPAVAVVAGVALAYLLVQMNFPRTLFFFAIELVLALLAIAAVGWMLGAYRPLSRPFAATPLNPA